MSSLIRSVASRLGVGIVGAWFAGVACGAPVVPASDDEIVERLPTRLLGIPRLSAQPVAASMPGRNGPAFAEAAATRATRLLDEARDRGDPRYAGYALAAIAPWKNDPAPPTRISIVAATLAQYQHDFAGSRRTLEAVVARDPGNPQAILTLATIARVQGQYAASDAACRQVSVEVYRSACLAENLALRGDFVAARRLIDELVAQRAARGFGGDAERWLTTTVAELEERAGNAVAADNAYRHALSLGRDSYLTLDYVDFLIAQGRAAEAGRLLVAEPQPFGDGVLLRLAIVRKSEGAKDADAMATEMRARFDAARERGDAISIHGREFARQLFALQGDAPEAVVVARENLRIQREPADFLVMAAAARAAGDRAASAEVAAQAKAIGLVDVRLDRLVAGDADR